MPKVCACMRACMCVCMCVCVRGVRGGGGGGGGAHSNPLVFGQVCHFCSHSMNAERLSQRSQVGCTLYLFGTGFQ